MTVGFDPELRHHPRTDTHMLHTRTSRATAGLGLIGFALLMVLFELTQPQLPGNPVDHLDVVAEHASTLTLSYVSFTLAQLFLIPGVLGAAALVRVRAPRLAGTIGGLGVIGAFGHGVFGGFALTVIGLADGGADRAATSTILHDVQNGPMGLFSIMGLIGLAPVMLLLAIAVWRTSVAPRWVAGTLGLFLVLQVALAGVATWAALASSLVGALAFFGLAQVVWRTAPSDSATHSSTANR